MFRRSLLIFLGFCLLALTLTVGYALTGLSSTPSALREARAAIRSHSYTECLRILSHAEQSMGPTGWHTERHELLKMRARCHLRLSNHVRARADLEQLVDHFSEDDPELLGELIRALIVTGEPEKALRRATRMLDTHGDDGRTHELAGEAQQAIYQKKLGAFVAELRRWVPPLDLPEATGAMLTYLYRRDSDPLARAGKAQLREIIKKHELAEFVVGTYQNDLDDIRDDIARAQDHYRRSLESPGTPVSAYHGLAYALKQGRRQDDLLALAETYLHRFHHIYALDALTDATGLHWEAGRHRAVVDLVDRFMPPGTWRAKLKAKQLGKGIRKVLLLKARSLHAIGDTEGLTLLIAELEEMAKIPQMDFEVETIFAQGFLMDLNKETWDLENLLNPLSWHPSLKNPPAGDDDLLAVSMRMRLNAIDRVARHTKDPMVHYQRILQGWVRVRPNDPEPYLRRARYLLDASLAQDALVDARRLFELAQTERLRNPFANTETKTAIAELREQALRLLAEAHDLAYTTSGRDARSMLEQCRQLGTSLPRDVAHPVMYLPLARLALDEGQNQVALAATQRAVQFYLWARWPRYLEAEAKLRAANPGAVVKGMEALLEQHPNDPEALRILRFARKSSGLSNNELLYDVALQGEPDAELALALLRNTVRRRDWRNARLIALHVLPIHGKNPEIALLTSEALEALGENGLAQRVLNAWLTKDADLSPTQSKRFLERKLLLAAASEDEFDAQKARLAEARTSHRHEPDKLFAMARALAARRLWEEAHGMMRPIFEEPVNRGHRTGAHYLFAGRMALLLGRRELAVNHLTAALSFEDGQAASKWLAALRLRDGQIESAAETFWNERANDQTSAALALRLGRPEVARSWAEEVMQRDPSHIGALCINALVGDVEATNAAALQLAREVPELLTNALMFGVDPEFQADALALTEELVRDYRRNPIAATLRGRALSRAERYKEALQILTPVAADPAAFDEMVNILAIKNPKELEQPAHKIRLMNIFEEHGNATPRRLRKLALTSFADALAAHPNVDKALDVLVDFWVEHAEDTEPGFPEADVLIEHGRQADALRLLRIIETRYSLEDRHEFLQGYGSAARKILSAPTDDAIVETIVDQVATWLDNYGPYGELVHLNLDLLDRAHRIDTADPTRTVQEHVEKERQLLLAHVGWFHGLADPDAELLVKTMQRLVPIEGLDVVMDRLERTLRWDPSLIGVWILRAQLYEKQGRPAEAMHNLGWWFDYINNSEVLLEYSRIAGESGLATPEDEQRYIRDLKGEWPRVLLVRGLLALRMARYQEAIDFISRGPGTPNGAHLYFRGLAHLGLGGAENAAMAQKLFEECGANYARTGLSEIAGHLGVQLSIVNEEVTVDETELETLGALQETLDGEPLLDPPQEEEEALVEFETAREEK